MQPLRGCCFLVVPTPQSSLRKLRLHCGVNVSLRSPSEKLPSPRRHPSPRLGYLFARRCCHRHVLGHFLARRAYQRHPSLRRAIFSPGGRTLLLAPQWRRSAARRLCGVTSTNHLNLGEVALRISLIVILRHPFAPNTITDLPHFILIGV
jgi:hypothetical protein